MEALVQKFLEIVADFHHISNDEAAKMINKCMNMVSIQLNLDLNIVHKQFYSETFLNNCLYGKCSEIDLAQCRKACHCVVFNGVCVSKRVKDYMLINKDPYKYAKTLSTVELEKLTKLVSYLHYNYGVGGLTDNSFDALQYNLNKRLKLKGKKYEKIGAEPVDKIRVELPFPMPSLNKIKPDTKECESFLNRIPRSGLVWSLKLDGISGLVVYNEGTIEGIYTRGNGEIGGDVTYLKDYIKFPNVSGNLVVRGEFILPRKTWEEKYKNGYYSNAGSFVRGNINQGYITPGLVDIYFVAYDILNNYNVDYLNRLRLLELENFNTVEFGYWENPLTFDIISTYIEKRETSLYNIDGMVLGYNVLNEVAVLENPENKVAFKMLLEEQIRHTNVINVDWNLSRYGKYIPVVVFEAVYVDDVRLTRATAHNAQHIKDWNMGVGTEIKVVRSGDVIPQVKDVVINEDIDAIFPDDTYSWYWKRKHILVEEIDSNPKVQIKRIYHFFSTLGVPRLGEKTAEKLWNAGMKEPEMITNAKVEDFLQIKGFGKKSSQTLYDNIRHKMQITPIDRYIIASTTLDLGIGRKLIKTLIGTFPDIIEENYDEEEIKLRLKSKKIAGIGPKRIENISKNIPKFRTFIMSLNNEYIQQAIKYNKQIRDEIAVKGYNVNIQDKIFVLTGFMHRVDYELEDYIYLNKGDIVTTVTSSTSAVIAATLSNITPKMREAVKLKVPVYSLVEFIDKFNINYKKAEIE